MKMYIGTHAEVGDGSGTVRGAFSYVDPSHQVRTVEYVADEYGKWIKSSLKKTHKNPCRLPSTALSSSSKHKSCAIGHSTSSRVIQ